VRPARSRVVSPRADRLSNSKEDDVELAVLRVCAEEKDATTQPRLLVSVQLPVRSCTETRTNAALDTKTFSGQ